MSDVHGAIETLKCPQCPVILHKDMYTKHLSMHGIGNIYQCLHCPKSTNVIEQLQIHMAHTHPDKSLFACARVLRTDKKLVSVIVSAHKIPAQPAIILTDFLLFTAQSGEYRCNGNNSNG